MKSYFRHSGEQPEPWRWLDDGEYMMDGDVYKDGKPVGWRGERFQGIGRKWRWFADTPVVRFERVDKMINDELGHYCRSLRRAKKCSLGHVANLLTLTIVEVSQVERGEKIPSREVIAEYVRHFSGDIAVFERIKASTDNEFGISLNGIQDRQQQIADGEVKPFRQAVADEIFNATVEKMRPFLIRVYNSGYQAGHHDTAEGGFIDIFPSEEETYHEDEVRVLIDEFLRGE